MQRHMEMNAPLFVAGLGKRHVEIFVTLQCAARAAFNHLMEVSVVREGAERCARGGVRLDLQGRTEMQFADPHLVPFEALEHVAGLLELHCQMARVVVDTKVTIQPVVARPVRPHAVEEVDGFLACFEVTERFRLEAEMKIRARDVLDAFP